MKRCRSDEKERFMVMKLKEELIEMDDRSQNQEFSNPAGYKGDKNKALKLLTMIIYRTKTNSD